ncbi:GDSL esterase/lipase, partial [Trifolium medium]|nr:GDSL esterase/lipase [Trifolium medium]
ASGIHFKDAVEQGCCRWVLSVCNTDDITCPDPSKYLFWDAVHLTQEG